MMIRKAVPNDIPLCLGVQASRNDGFFKESDYENSVGNPLAIFLVAEVRSKVVGYVLGYVNPTKHQEALIQSTMVHASHGNRGIGSSLVRGLTDVAFDELGVTTIYAEAEKGPDRFYQKCGFRQAHVWSSMRMRASERAGISIRRARRQPTLKPSRPFLARSSS